MANNRIDKNIDEIDVRIIDLMILNKNNRDFTSPQNTSFYHTEKSQKLDIGRLCNFWCADKLSKIWI